MKYLEILDKQKMFFIQNKTKEYNLRLHFLIKLKNEIIKYLPDIYKALYQDLGKSEHECYLTEISLVLSELNYIIKNLKKWMKPKKVKTPLFLFKAKSYIYQEPYGQVLILSPWNYPFQLSLVPLIAAVSAGNTVILKPSSSSLNTSKIIKKIINNVFDSSFVEVIIGSSTEAEELLKLKFDYIFFTGSIKIGKKVMEYASKNLTPITLELGGKSPCIIDSNVNMKKVVRRIIFGKFLNAGQTCIAPDYILIKKESKDDFIKFFKEDIINFYTNNILDNKDYPKIINEHHYNRLINLIKEQNIVFGGNYKDNKIEPTLLDDINFDSNIMKDEIFGPILPIITFNNFYDLINLLKEKEKPLALYLFTEDKKIEDLIISNISFGGGTINDTIMHFTNPNLPFGGVGLSGIGNYHGYNSFKTFSHEKSVLKRSLLIDFKMRYHPLTDKKIKKIKKIIK